LNLLGQAPTKMNQVLLEVEFQQPAGMLREEEELSGED
jgi:hypothetical protein